MHDMRRDDTRRCRVLFSRMSANPNDNASPRKFWPTCGPWPPASRRRSARVTLTGAEPALPSSFRVGAAAQTTIAAAGLAAAEIWR